MCRAGFACCLLLGIDLGSKLSAVALAKLWDNFPCRALVQSIFLQKSHNELKFIPWKHITSEVQADREKQVCQKKEKKLLDILALAAGQVDLPECELPSGSPYVIQKLLSLRAICCALVGWCHLGSAKLFILKFMALYAAPGLGALGLRGPTVQEAETADAEVCRQLVFVRSSVAKGKMAKVRRALCRGAMHFKQGNAPMTSAALRMNMNIVYQRPWPDGLPQPCPLVGTARRFWRPVRG